MKLIALASLSLLLVGCGSTDKPQQSSRSVNQVYQFGYDFNVSDYMRADDPRVVSPKGPIVTVGPVYPKKAAVNRLEGWVKADLLVNEQGRIKGIKVVESSPVGIFEQAAIQSLRRWLYKPAKLDGKAVPVIYTVQLDFSLG